MVRPRTICLLLALITVLVYSPVRHAAFVVFDDPDYIANSHVEAGLTWSGVKWGFTTWHASNWHPVTWLSHMLDATLFGPNPGAQHLVNVLFHAANAVLLFLFLFRTTEKMWPAALVAALFAWHPLHVESVAWVSERKDVLSTFFGLLALTAYAKYSEQFKAHPPSPGFRRPSEALARQVGATRGSRFKVPYAWALVLFALSLMAKPMLVTLPFVMLLLDIWPLRRISAFGIRTASTQPKNTNHESRNTVSALILEKAPFLLLTIASCIITFLAQRAEAVVSLEQRPFGLRFANALVAYAEYLAKTIWPVKLAVIYPLPGQIPMWQIAASVIVLGLISVLAWLARRRPYLIIGWLWFLGTLVPVIGLVQVGGQALADRYTYVPLIGIFIAIAYGAADLMLRFRISTAVASAVGGLVLVVNLFVTARQLDFWQNSEMLFTHAIDVTKDNAIAHINLGVALEQEDRREDALAQYRKAVDIDPNRFQAHNNFANLLSAMDMRDAALQEYQEALRLNPHAPLAHANFGTLLSEMGRFDDAMREYAEAMRLDPEDPRPHYLMGKACLRHGQSTEAVKHFRDALRMAPNDFQDLTWLARVLASDPDSAVRNGKEAVSLAQQANDMTGGGQPFVLDTLAMAYAEAGRFPEAGQTVQKAIELATSAGAQKTVPEMQERLRLYQSGQPYREDFTRAPAG